MQNGMTLFNSSARAIDATSLEKHGRYFVCDAVPTSVTASRDAAFVGFGDGYLRIFRPNLPMQELSVCGGTLLCMASHGSGVLIGSDDGRLLRVTDGGVGTELANFGHHWVDSVASARNGTWAASVGKTVHVQDAEGRTQKLDHPSTVGGLAFCRRGDRLAVAHYGGVTLWTRGRRNWKSISLRWAGSHVGVCWSPDHRFIVTTMQENALHGWRLRDKADMRMSGYPTKVKSVAWVGSLPHLASSGSHEAICWPFDGANGPMGKRPLTLCDDGGALATAVAAMPGQDSLLCGFENGGVLMSDLDLLVSPRVIKKSGGAAISNMIVTPETNWLLAADDDGVILWGPLGVDAA